MQKWKFEADERYRALIMSRSVKRACNAALASRNTLNALAYISREKKTEKKIKNRKNTLDSPRRERE